MNFSILSICLFTMLFSLSAFCSVVNGYKYRIKAIDNTYVEYKNRVFSLTGNLDQAVIVKVIKLPQDKNEKKDKIVLKLLTDNRFISGRNDHTVKSENRPNAWEVFEIEVVGNNKSYLKSVAHSGDGKDYYLRTNFNDKSIDMSPNRQEWEKLEFIDEDDNFKPERDKFLGKSIIVLDKKNRVNVGAKVSSFYDSFAAVQIQDYDLGFPAVFLIIQFPPYFKNILPAKILEIVEKRDVKKLEIFWVIQSNKVNYYGNESKILLKPHLWLHPQTPEEFNGEIFSKPIELGIFAVDNILENDIKLNEVLPFTIEIHDSKFSDDSAKLSSKIGGEIERVSLWSLAVDESTQSAAATLHWLVSPDDNNNLKKLFILYAGKPLSVLIKAIQDEPQFKDFIKLNL